MQNEITGEHTCIVLRPLQSDDVEGVAGVPGGWLDPFNQGVSFNIISKPLDPSDLGVFDTLSSCFLVTSLSVAFAI